MLIILALACPLPSVLAQETSAIDRMDAVRNVTPPSPEAASLGKYTQWPVNLNTGLANINVPLCELKGRTVSVPVSVSHHSSGIRVGMLLHPLAWMVIIACGLISRAVIGPTDNQDIWRDEKYG